MKRIAIATTAAVSVLLLAGCGTGSVSQDDVESKVKEQFSKVITDPFTVTCDGDLPAKKGKTERCVLKDDQGQKLGVTVKVTSVEDGKAQMHFQADDKLMDQ